MRISDRYTWTLRTRDLLLVAGLCLGCGSKDTSNLDPSALDGVGGSTGRLDSGGEQCAVAFITPEPGDAPLLLGPDDDEDGEPCGTDFTTSVDVSTNAHSLTLLVDDQPVATQIVSGSVARFSSVLIGSRSPDASRLKVEATMQGGETCEVTRDWLLIDCEGPSCALVGPSENPYLNAADDVDGNTDGLQANFTIETNPENAGQETRLILDGDLDAARSAASEGEGDAARARFSAVTLDEGPVRRAQAQCQDAAGNITRSTIASWAVDITPCGIAIGGVADGADPITRLIDDVAGSSGIQVPAVGSVSGEACNGIRAGVCGQPLGAFSGEFLESNGDWSLELTLADVTGSGEVCAEVQDAAGNVAQARAPINVRSDDPVVEISSPASGTNINLTGTNGGIADLQLGNGTCEAAFVVRCTDAGANVELFAGASSLGSQTCQATAGLPPPYEGIATFATVSLSTLPNAGQQHSVTARQTVAGLTGSSEPVLIGSDCQAPDMAFAQPLCGSQLSLDDDDQQPAAGLQRDVLVSNGGEPAVTLTVTRADGSETLSATGSGPVTVFAAVHFGDPGNVELSASATDAAGNTGTVSCQFRVVNQPTVNLLVPSDSAVLTSADDCDASGAYGVSLSGTTNAPAGSSVDVAVGGGSPVALSPVVAGGAGTNTFGGCVVISDGIDQTLSVTVTESGRPPGSNTVTVTVDTQPPTDSVAAASVSVQNRRGGAVNFTWSHVADTGGGLLDGYELRCAASAIVDENAWSGARVLNVSTVPAAPGAPDAAEAINGFRVGTTEFCVLRGRDDAGALTPLLAAGGNAQVTINFIQTDYTAVANSTSSFTNVVGVGDINGDSFEDLLYGTLNQGLQLFFGGTPLDTTADVAITGVTSGLGAVMAGVGDVNGDTLPDFAVSARALSGSSGTVYLFYGRSSSDPWPSSLDVTSGGCGADVCLVGSAAGAFFGWDISATDFDGNGINDLIISARANNSGDGSVYVILGGAQLDLSPGSNSISVPAGSPNGFRVDAPANRSNFGFAVAGVGAGLDGRGDIAIGANGVFGDDGALFFLAGEEYPVGSSGLIAPSATPLVEVASGVTTDFAAPVRAIGDFDGDGLADVGSGRNFLSEGGLGAAEVYLRGVAGLSTAQGSLLTFAASTGTDNDYATYIATGFHPHLGTIGDLDGDGLTELVIGSLSPGGSAALFYGGTTAQGRDRANADFTLATAGPGIMVPNFVGDIDGDGFDDLALVDCGAGGANKLILLH